MCRNSTKRGAFSARRESKRNFRRRLAPGEATVLARRAVEQSRQLVIVCGGDGTVNEAVNGLACSQVPLAVLPAGTANVLAKELSLPWNLPRAAERIIRRAIPPHRAGSGHPGKIQRRASLFPESCGRGSGRSAGFRGSAGNQTQGRNPCVLAGRLSPALALQFSALSHDDGRERDRRRRSSSWAARSTTAARSRSRPKPIFSP